MINSGMTAFCFTIRKTQGPPRSWIKKLAETTCFLLFIFENKEKTHQSDDDEPLKVLLIEKRVEEV
jgi:hypothetical protein